MTLKKEREFSRPLFEMRETLNETLTMGLWVEHDDCDTGDGCRPCVIEILLSFTM